MIGIDKEKLDNYICDFIKDNLRIKASLHQGTIEVQLCIWETDQYSLCSTQKDFCTVYIDLF